MFKNGWNTSEFHQPIMNFLCLQIAAMVVSMVLYCNAGKKGK